MNIDKTGLVVDTFDDLLNAAETELKTVLGQDFQISENLVLGNVISVGEESTYNLQQALQYLVSQLDPEKAEGVWLDIVCAYNEIYRFKAQKTVVTRNANGTEGVVVEIGEISLKTASGVQIINSEQITIPASGYIAAKFECLDNGPIYIDAETETTIISAPSGITLVDNQTAVDVGRNQETDEELRLRRKTTLQSSGSTTLTAIKGKLKDIESVDSCHYIENEESETVDGIPPNSFEFIVLGGDDQEIAQTIWEKKAGGIKAHGSTTVTVTDDEGYTHSIGFTRPEEISVYFKANVYSDETLQVDYINNLKQSLVATATSKISVGDDVDAMDFYSCFDIAKITKARNLQVSTDDETWVDLVELNIRQIARFDVSRVTISQV